MAAVRRELLVHTFKNARVLLRPVSEAADTKVKEVGFKTATVTTKTPVPLGNVSPGGCHPASIIQHHRSASALGPGCVKTPAFNLRVESSSRFGQSENQKFCGRLSEEDNRENDSTLSWLAHVFTQPRSEPEKASRSWSDRFAPAS
jgi:hypothetical protein